MRHAVEHGCGRSYRWFHAVGAVAAEQEDIMLDTTVQPGTSIVTLDAHGGITAGEMLHMREVLDEVLRDHDSVRMVAIRGEIDVGDICPRALWLDLTSAGYVKRLERLAVVTDVDWEAKVSE